MRVDSTSRGQVNSRTTRGRSEMPTLALIKGFNAAPRAVRSKMDTLELTPKVVEAWKSPPFQRPIRVNAKVMAVSEELKCQGGVIPGTLTLGLIDGVTYVVDGQHRIEAFKLSGLSKGYSDVRLCEFDSMADMGEEFVKLNQSLVNFRPDDILRGLEGVIPGLAALRKTCPFVSYDQVRRGDGRAPVVSMSAVLRCWFAAGQDVPSASGRSAVNVAREMTEEQWQQLAQFLNVALGAWGRDPEYYRLWGSLNIALCMWLWRKNVMAAYSAKAKGISVALYSRCLMALSTSTDYLSWLVGRNLSDRDRSPGYLRIKSIMAKRLAEEDPARRVSLPAPPWCSNGTKRVAP